MEDQVKRVLTYCEAKIAEGEKAKVQFLENFNINPIYAFEWAQGPVETLAIANKCHIIKNMIEEVPEKVQKLQGYLLEEIIRESQWCNDSTSVFSNKVNQYKKSATSRIYHDMQMVLD